MNELALKNVKDSLNLLDTARSWIGYDMLDQACQKIAEAVGHLKAAQRELESGE